MANNDNLEINGTHYRVIGRYEKEWEEGYIEPEVVRYNILQRKVSLLRGLISFWKEVERERVPSFAWIARLTLGYTDWKSPLMTSLKDKTHKIFQ